MKIDHFKNAIKVINVFFFFRFPLLFEINRITNGQMNERVFIKLSTTLEAVLSLQRRREMMNTHSCCLYGNHRWNTNPNICPFICPYQRQYESVPLCLIVQCTPNEEKPLPPQVQSFKNALNLSPDQTKQILDLAPKINDLRKKVMISNYVLNLLSAPNVCCSSEFGFEIEHIDNESIY